MTATTAPETYPTASAADLRNADLETLAAALENLNARAVDVTVPAPSLVSTLGGYHVSGITRVTPAVEASMDENGVTPGRPETIEDLTGTYVPTRVADYQIAQRLGIPPSYLRKLRDNAMIGTYDENVNAWIERAEPGTKYLLRLLTGGGVDGAPGIVRAMLSDNYRPIDNMDVLIAALSGIRDAGVRPIFTADLTDRRMIVRALVPEVSVMAPTLLDGYRDPWTRGVAPSGWDAQRWAGHRAAVQERIARGGLSVGDPVLFSGVRISNSETGGGRFLITPEVVVLSCLNGQTMIEDGFGKTHLGAELAAGQIEWGNDTIYHNRELVKAQARDAMAKFISTDYLTAKRDELERAAGIIVPDAPAVISAVAVKLGFTKDEARGILDFFIDGGQRTTGGVMQAVTAYAQTIADADAAWDMQRNGVKSMHEAVRAVRALASV